SGSRTTTSRGRCTTRASASAVSSSRRRTTPTSCGTGAPRTSSASSLRPAHSSRGPIGPRCAEAPLQQYTRHVKDEGDAIQRLLAALAEARPPDEPDIPEPPPRREAVSNEDRYELEGEIGKGSSATVYEAEDLTLHRKVAIKVLE